MLNNPILLAAIQAARETLEGRIGEVRSEVSLLRQDSRHVADRVTATETRISELEDTVQILKRDMAGM